MLKITLVSGQEQDIPFDPTSTLTVTNQGFVDGVATPITASYSEIASLEIVADPQPEVATVTSEDPPAPIVPTGGVPVDTNAVTTEPTSSDTAPVDEPVSAPAGPGEVTAVDGSGNPIDATSDVVVPATDPEPAGEPDTSNPQLDEQTQPQSVGEALAAATPPTGDPGDETAVTEPTDAPADPPPALVEAVAAAGAVVDAAVADPAAHVDHLAQAQTDIAAALNTWPDDPNLLDLKTQLADLAADAAEASA